MAKMYTYTFTINIFPLSESYVDYEVTAKERRLIKSAIEDGYMFEDVEDLEDLYNRVMEAAKVKLQEDVDMTGEDIDIDDLEYSVEFGEDFDDE